MKSFTINETQAREFYPEAPSGLKSLLEENFGGKEFFLQKITDKVKSFEDACSALNIDSSAVCCAGDDAYNTASKQLQIIIKALNEGWTPDWNNSSQYKYYPWFYMDSDRGFGLLDVDLYFSHSTVGSRLCFKSEALAEYAATQFKELYRIYMTTS